MEAQNDHLEGHPHPFLKEMNDPKMTL